MTGFVVYLATGSEYGKRQYSKADSEVFRQESRSRVSQSGAAFSSVLFVQCEMVLIFAAQ